MKVNSSGIPALEAFRPAVSPAAPKPAKPAGASVFNKFDRVELSSMEDILAHVNREAKIDLSQAQVLSETPLELEWTDEKQRMADEYAKNKPETREEMLPEATLGKDLREYLEMQRVWAYEAFEVHGFDNDRAAVYQQQKMLEFIKMHPSLWRSSGYVPEVPEADQ